MPQYQPQTRLQLRNVVRRELMDTAERWWTDGELNQYLDDWVAEMQGEFEFVWGTSTVSTSSATITLSTITPSVHRLDAVVYLGTNTSGGYRLAGRSLQDLDVLHREWRSASADTPREVVQYDSRSFMLWPPPTTTIKVVLEYPVEVSFIDDTTINPLPWWTQYSAKSYVCSKAYLRPGPVNDLKRALRYRKIFEESKERIKRLWHGFLPDKYLKLKPSSHYEADILMPPSAMGGVPSWTILNDTFTSEAPSGAIDGTNVTFTVSKIPTEVKVFLNGLLQAEGIDFTMSGTTITFVNPPQVGDGIVVWIWLSGIYSNA